MYLKGYRGGEIMSEIRIIRKSMGHSGNLENIMKTIEVSILEIFAELCNENEDSVKVSCQ